MQINLAPQWVVNALRGWNAGRAALANPEGIRIAVVPARHAGGLVDNDTALTVSAYWRAINYISGQIAGLPWDVIRETSRASVKLPAHPVWRILHKRVSDEFGPFTWRETMISLALSWGNAYAEIERDGYDRPLALHLITPD